MLSKKKRSWKGIFLDVVAIRNTELGARTHTHKNPETAFGFRRSLSHTFGSRVGSRASDERSGWKEPTLHVHIISPYLNLTQREVVTTTDTSAFFFPNTPQCLLIINGFWFIPFSLWWNRFFPIIFFLCRLFFSHRTIWLHFFSFTMASCPPFVNLNLRLDSPFLFFFYIFFERSYSLCMSAEKETTGSEFDSVDTCRLRSKLGTVSSSCLFVLPALRPSPLS